MVSNAAYTSARGPEVMRRRMRYLPSFCRAFSNVRSFLRSCAGKWLQYLEQSRRAHAAPNAHGADDELGASALSFDQGMSDHPGARHTVRVTDRDGAAVDVEQLVWNAEPVTAINHLDCKGLVQLPEPDIFNFKTALL